MKHLYVVRHAKSSWSHPDLRDFDRPLNRRGEKNAPHMGRFLRDRDVRPDGMVSSPANRAYTTARLIAKELGFPQDDIIAEPSLYGAGVQDTLEIVRSVDSRWITAMIFGHNPTTTSFVNWLANTDITNVPTCGVAHIRIATDSWMDISNDDAELVDFFVPKELPTA